MFYVPSFTVFFGSAGRKVKKDENKENIKRNENKKKEKRKNKNKKKKSKGVPPGTAQKLIFDTRA